MQCHAALVNYSALHGPLSFRLGTPSLDSALGRLVRFLTKFALALMLPAFVPFPPLPAVASKARAAGPVRDQQRTIVLYEGVVDGKSAERFLVLIAKSEDKIVGLKIQSDTIETTRYSVIADGEQLIITAGDPLNAPRELVVNGGTGRSLAYHLIDGFYLIKFGGSHAAGALSWGAIPVDEARIRLDPSIAIVRKQF